MTEKSTVPAGSQDQEAAAAHLIIEPAYVAPNGATWVHRDLVKVAEPWADEAHVKPPSGEHRFGDVESWVAYVQRFARAESSLLTWNAQGLRAALDHHTNFSGEIKPGRNQWWATHPFELSPEWRAWQGIANGQPVPHKAAIERLEDRALDITEPVPTELVSLLRSLRSHVSSQATVDLKPDGTANVTFQKDQEVRGASGTVTLPPEFAIEIPILSGHQGDDGKTVRYRLWVRVRVSVDNDAKLAFRFSLTNAERSLEEALLDRVAKAKALLGEGFPVLRAAGN